MHFCVMCRHPLRDHSIPHRPFPIGGPLDSSLKPLPLYLTVTEIFNGERNAMVHMTSNDLQKGQGHSFWYQSISHNTTS